MSLHEKKASAAERLRWAEDLAGAALVDTVYGICTCSVPGIF